MNLQWDLSSAVWAHLHKAALRSDLSQDEQFGSWLTHSAWTAGPLVHDLVRHTGDAISAVAVYSANVVQWFHVTCKEHKLAIIININNNIIESPVHTHFHMLSLKCKHNQHVDYIIHKKEVHLQILSMHYQCHTMITQNKSKGATLFWWS